MNKPIMKTKEEIEQLAEQYVSGVVSLDEQEKRQTEIAYMTGYTQCQVHGEDMADAKGEPLYYVEDLSDWDGTLNDGLEDEPFISDDFQIGPDGAYEHTQGLSISPREKASELIVDYQTAVKSLDYNEAKQCALVMADEIKRILYDQDLMIRYDYWFEVKHEIEKL